MDGGVRWFFAGMLEARLLDEHTCFDLSRQLGNDADLLTVAQAVLDQGLCADFDAVQRIMSGAYEMAKSGTVPPDTISTDDQPPTTSSSAPAPATVSTNQFEQVESLGEDDARAFVETLLAQVRRMGASDLHLSAGSPPFVRRALVVEMLGDQPLSSEAAMILNGAVLTPERRAAFLERQDLDFPLALSDGCRYRVNLMVHKGGVAGSYRVVSNTIHSLAELGFRDCKTITDLLDHHNGLVLVTGPVGSGKTTTLAALIDILNNKRRDHIITVEQPIEIVQRSRHCNITQREVGSHTKSFATALKGALREDPDIIVVAELRDLETIEMAITAAETGHLVIGTLHTSDAATTLNRLLDVFPPDQQPQIRAMTAESLRGIICQRLVPTNAGGLTVAAEVLVNTIAVANTIREGKTHQLKAILQTGVKQGMRMMDQSFVELFHDGIISREQAELNIGDAGFIAQLDQASDDTEPSEPERKRWFR